MVPVGKNEGFAPAKQVKRGPTTVDADAAMDQPAPSEGDPADKGIKARQLVGKPATRMP